MNFEISLMCDLVSNTKILFTLSVTVFVRQNVTVHRPTQYDYCIRLLILIEFDVYYLVTRMKMRRGIFQGDSPSPLLFVLALIPLTMVLRNVKAGYDLARGKGVVNHLLFMDDLKLCGKSERQVDSLVNTVRI